MFDFTSFWEDKETAVYFLIFLIVVGCLWLLYKGMKDVYLTGRFFAIASLVVVLFAASYFLNDLTFFQSRGFDPIVFPWAILCFLLVLVMVDALLLFANKRPLKIRRHLPRVFSLGDPNPIRITVENISNQKFDVSAVDEIPIEFQKRDFEFNFDLEPFEEREISYELNPKVRGEYHFGHVNVFLTSTLGILQRRYEHKFPMTLPVYPSLIQMKNFELKAFDKVTMDKGGVKRMRRIGHSYEFEQIKDYVRGDDYRSVNWKATSRSGKLMVNQYEDERAQQVYCIIDKSRNMKMPFEGLSLMDYAVNATLVISNIALKKHDRAGMMTFSDIIGSTIKADRRANQLNNILQTLYREKERNLEANYELLYRAVRNLISGRSLIFLFTNFESMYALERVLPLLRRMNNQHLLVVVFFENSEIRDYADKKVETVEEIYHQTVAKKFIYEKEQIVSKLKQYGIQAILTKPEDLSMNSVNKYLELKSRGLI